MNKNQIAYALVALVVALFVLFAIAPLIEGAAHSFESVTTAFNLANGKLTPAQQH